MNILMFGWEFPPNISGGLGTACYGITKSLASSPHVKITFVIPKVHGNEPRKQVKLIGANQIDLIKSKIRIEQLQVPMECFSIESNVVPYIDPSLYENSVTTSVQNIIAQPSTTKAPSIQFTGKYGLGLMSEIHNFSVISEYLAKQTSFDLIHAHDWLTFPAGIAAKKTSGKPLVIHVHATDFDRSGGHVNQQVYQIEKEGMEQADCVICVSNRTRQTVIEKYQIDPQKVKTVHNGVDFDTASSTDELNIKNQKLVTFLGRITSQKGPEYFIQMAELILSKMKDVRFVMAGSGDLYHYVIRKVAQSHIADRFLFTGFLKGKEVCRLLKQSSAFVMPSVSEPFGICPLEAMQSGIPTIISRQSGVSEVIKHTIKVDFWDVHAMADAIHALLSYPALSQMMTKYGKKESGTIKWEHAATKLEAIYHDLIRA